MRAPRERWGYRRKICLHAALVDQQWAFGLLKKRGWEKDLISIPQCPLHAPEVNQALSLLREFLPPDLPLAFVLISGAVATLVLKSKPSEQWHAGLCALENPLAASGIHGLQINWNPSAGRRVLSSRHQERLFGPEFFHDGEGFYGAQSFRQQIPELASKALSLAEEFFSPNDSLPVVDFYSGSGSSLALWGKHGWSSVGVELGGEACEASQRNAPAALVLRGKVEDRLPQVDAFLEGRDFLLYSNPPREGHSPEVIAWIQKCKPKRMAYLSCNARTLARDLGALADLYELKSVQPFDFFPQTNHVEALSLLKRRG